MPAIAPAAFARIRSEIRFSPEMSTTEYVIDTSVAPTYGRVSPEASVETISFGTPTGRPRIACAAIDELPEPPTERMPSSRPSACKRRTISAAPRPIASTAAPRSPASRSAADVGPGGGRDLLLAHVGLRQRLEHARVDQHDVHALLAQPRAQVVVLLALRVERAEQDDGGHALLILRGGARPPAGAESLSLPRRQLGLRPVLVDPDRAVAGERDLRAVGRPGGLDHVHDRSASAGAGPCRRRRRCRSRSGRAARLLWKASRSPSGDHAGRPLTCLSFVSLADAGSVGAHDVELADREARLAVVVGDQLPVRGPGRVGGVAEAAARPAEGFPPPAGTTNSAPSRPKTIRLPSGDQLGWSSFCVPLVSRPRPGAVGAHDVDVRRAPSRVLDEGDPSPVRRPGGLAPGRRDPAASRRVALLLRQPSHMLAVGVGAEERVVAVLRADEDEVGRPLRLRAAAGRKRERARARPAATRRPASSPEHSRQPNAGRPARRRDSGAATPGRRQSAAAVVSAAISPPTMTSWRSAIDGRDAEVLLDQEDAQALLLELAERLDQHLDDRRREALGGLVHDQQLRVRDQGAADREHLLLAAGELGAAVALALGEPREELVDAVDRPAARCRSALATMRRCSSTLSDGNSRRPCGT